MENNNGNTKDIVVGQTGDVGINSRCCTDVPYVYHKEGLNYIPEDSKFLIEIPFINPTNKAGLYKTDKQIEEEQNNLSIKPQKIVAAGKTVINSGFNVGDYVYISKPDPSTVIRFLIQGIGYISLEAYCIHGKVENIEQHEKELREELELIEKKFEGKYKTNAPKIIN